MFEPVGFNDINRFELFSELAAGKSLLFEPDDIGFGEVDEQPALVFSKRHTGLGEFKKKFGVWGQFFHRDLSLSHVELENV